MDAASIEQMNKVRASLGMAPLPVPGAAAGGPEFKSKDDDSESEEERPIKKQKKEKAVSDVVLSSHSHWYLSRCVEKFES